MNNVLIIGLNTFREAIRDKVLYSLFFFATAVIMASLAFGALSVHEEVRLTTDLGLGGMSLFLIAIAIFSGVSLVYKELERKTIYTLLPKPIRRFEFVLGKFAGLTLTLVVLGLLMAVVLVVTLALQGATLGANLAIMVSLVLLEVLVLTAVAVFFSSFSTPYLSGLFTAGVFLLGRSVPDIRAVAGKMEHPVLAGLLKGIARIVPNLRLFFSSGSVDLTGRHVSVHGTFVEWGYVGWAAGYALLYIGLILALSVVLFSRRDFV